jgi:hypothetical protein
VRLRAQGYAALAKVFARLTQRETQEFVNTLRSVTLNACSERGLPIPPVGAGLEIEGGSQTVSTDGIHTQPRGMA